MVVRPDERLGLEAIITEHLRDSRQRLNTQFRLPDLLRQSRSVPFIGRRLRDRAIRQCSRPAASSSRHAESRRATASGAFFRYKTIIGDGRRARSPAGQGSEAVLGL